MNPLTLWPDLHGAVYLLKYSYKYIFSYRQQITWKSKNQQWAELKQTWALKVILTQSYIMLYVGLDCVRLPDHDLRDVQPDGRIMFMFMFLFLYSEEKINNLKYFRVAFLYLSIVS